MSEKREYLSIRLCDGIPIDHWVNRIQFLRAEAVEFSSFESESFEVDAVSSKESPQVTHNGETKTCVDEGVDCYDSSFCHSCTQLLLAWRFLGGGPDPIAREDLTMNERDVAKSRHTCAKRGAIEDERVVCEGPIQESSGDDGSESLGGAPVLSILVGLAAAAFSAVSFVLFQRVDFVLYIYVGAGVVFFILVWLGAARRSRDCYMK